MCHPMQELRAVRPLAKLLLTAAVAAFLVLSATASTRAAEVNQVVFQASYTGLFEPQMTDDGNPAVYAVLPGDGTYLPESMGYFSHIIHDVEPNLVNGVFMLYGGETGTVTGTYTGSQTDPDEMGVVLISGAYSIDSGWLDGFGAAIGGGSLTGAFNLNTGEMTVTLTGTLSPATPTPE